jgi:hypothetical protein
MEAKMPEPRTTEDYVSNCFFRTLTSEIHPARYAILSEHFAEAMKLAVDVGSLDAAHDYLLGVCKRAEAGAYATDPKI